VRDYLFAYGTLLSGALEPQVRSVLKRHCRVGPKASVPGRLIDLGTYPGALVADAPDQRIHGRVIELLAPQHALPVLDAYEGYRAEAPRQSLYVRARVTAALEDGGTVECWIYWLTRPPRPLRLIPGGDWTAWRS
jgi:gamma-glutamylcyclotransferase (GGCT)/AIG2-like uncharacterized protein YtfP